MKKLLHVPIIILVTCFHLLPGCKSLSLTNQSSYWATNIHCVHENLLNSADADGGMDLFICSKSGIVTFHHNNIVYI